MTEIFSQRLKAARLVLGFSQKELSDKVNISKQAISKYEKGLMLPNSVLLIQFTNVLKRKPDYFFRPFQTTLDKVDFRKKSRLSGKRLAALKAIIADKLERYLELESILGIDEVFKNPIENIKIKNFEDVENAVKQLLIEWNLGDNPMPNIIELLENKHIKVIEIDGEKYQDFDGLSAYVNDKIPVIVINQQHDIIRKRFTILHELGHLLLSIPDEATQKEKESYCNRFAGAMLIPKSQIQQELGLKRTRVAIQELIELKEYYGISIAALVYRANDLGIISDYKANQFWKQRNQNIQLKREIGFGNYEGKEHSGRFEQLLYKALAEELITLNKAAVLAEKDLEFIRNSLKLI